jgi:hypothetical protein
MSGRKVHKSNINLEECYKLVRQSGSKGIRAAELARKMGKDRSTIYDYLNSLEVRGRILNNHGLWYAKTESPAKQETTNQPSEKEIEIVLPMPKNKWFHAARLKAHADYLEDLGMKKTAKIEKTILEQLNETRTIRIRGKNVDDIDLEKIGNLIQQATERSSKFSFGGIFKKLRKSTPKSTAANSEQAMNSSDNKPSEK